MDFLESPREINGIAFLLMLAPAALRPNFSRRRKKNLQLRIRKNHRADVAALHHHAALVSRAALFGDEHVPHSPNRRNARSRLGNFRAANRFGHIFAVEQHALRSILGAQVDVRVARERARSSLASSEIRRESP